MIKAVFFDVDGTLIDTKGAIGKVANETFEDLGIGQVDAGYFAGLLKRGLGLRYHLTEVAKRPELYPTAKEAFIRHYAEHIGEYKPFDGVQKLLEELKERGVRTGIFTSQHSEMLRLTLERFGLSVDLALSRDDVANGKPAPDQVTLLCGKLSVKPENALSVGDWTGDIEAGKSAGTRTAGVLTGLCSREELEKEKPDYIFEKVTGIRDVV